MSETLSGTVSSLRRAGELLSGGELAALDPGAPAFGAGGPGRLGELGRDLHLLWQRTLDARIREAVTHAARLDELADAVARAASGYADVDEGGRRHIEVL